MVRAQGRNEGPKADPDDAEHGRDTLLGTGGKINDHRVDGVLSTDSHAVGGLSWIADICARLAGVSTVTYVVKAGDWLAKIAEEHGSTVSVIWNHPGNGAHRAKRGSPDVLYPGDVLVIPVAEAPPPAKLPPPPPQLPPPPPATGAPWPYETNPQPMQPPAPRWACPADICVCSDHGEAGGFELSVMLCDDTGNRMPYARCRALLNGVVVNLGTPYADGEGWLTITLKSEPDTLVLQWAPASTPIAPEYPYCKRYHVQLDPLIPQEAGRRRLSNLGFAAHAELHDNVAAFQQHFAYTEVTGVLADIEEDLSLYHDLACMPPVADGALSTAPTTPLARAGALPPHAGMPPAPPPAPPRGHGNKKTGGGVLPGQGTSAPPQCPRTVDVMVRLIDDDRLPFALRSYLATTDVGACRHGTTDEDGIVSIELPSDTLQCAISLAPSDPRHPQHLQHTWHLVLAPLPASTEVKGALLRLRHLDYWTGPIVSDLTEHARASLQLFQADHGLTPTGELDAPTAALLDSVSVSQADSG